MRFAVGDMSTETSMEDILSSIKRIIAEEGDGPVSRVRKPVRAPAPAYDEEDEDEVLELNDAVSDPLPPRAAAAAAPAPAPAAASQPEIDAAILSARAAEASRGALEALSRMVVKPEAPGADSLEGLVREMLRPMLRDWLDAKLPAIVETMVAREIARISGRE
jgi:cell pole-organizing protein PopZ